MDLVHYFYSVLLHVLAVQFGHHQAGHYFTKSKGERPLLTKSRYNVTVKLLQSVVAKPQLIDFL
jgi:hypothetical protein